MTEKVEDLFLPVLCFHLLVEASGGPKLKGFQMCFKGPLGFDLPWGAWGCVEPWGLPEARRASQVAHPSCRDVCPEKGVLFSEQRTAPCIGALLQCRSFMVALSGNFVRKRVPYRLLFFIVTDSPHSSCDHLRSSQGVPQGEALPLDVFFPFPWRYSSPSLLVLLCHSNFPCPKPEEHYCVKVEFTSLVVRLIVTSKINTGLNSCLCLIMG